MNNRVEIVYKYLNEKVEYIRKAQEITYVESILHFLNDIAKENYEPLLDVESDKKILRLAFGYLMLKGYNTDQIEGVMVAPDSLSLIIAYLVKLIFEQDNVLREKDVINLTDGYVCGGQMLFSIMEQLSQEPKNISVNGIFYQNEVLEITAHLANILEVEVELFLQSSLKECQFKNNDIVVLDYDRKLHNTDSGAVDLSHLELGSVTQHATLLTIENQVQSLVEGGYLIAVLESSIVDYPHYGQFLKLMNEKTHLQGILQLPMSMFKNSKRVKSIYFWQKQGEDVIEPETVLVTKFPGLNEREAFQQVLINMKNWFEINKD